MKNNFWTRYWLYYTTADYLGIFTGMLIYGLFYYPFEYSPAYRLPPDFMQLISTTGAAFIFWYFMTGFLPLQTFAFVIFKNRKRSAKEYFTYQRIVILLLHSALLPSIMNISNGHQFFIPLGCVMFFNVIAFSFIESRERVLT